MNNLTTRKIVLGMLMALVLAFSVQGIADALTFGTSRSGDLETKAPNETFTIRFTASPKSPVRKPGFKPVPSRDESDPAVSVPAAERTNMFYDDDPDIDYIQGSTSRVDYDDAHDYDQETIKIEVTGDANIIKVGSRNINATKTFDMYERTHDSYDTAKDHEKLSSSSVTLVLEATGVDGDDFTVKVTDETLPADAPTKPPPITFTLYAVKYQSAITTTTNVTTLAGDGVESAFDNDVRPLGSYFTFPGTDVPVHYSIEGSGTLSIRETYGDSSPTSVKTASKTLSTSSSAPVFIDMRRGTNKVTASVPSGTPETVIFIFTGSTPDKYPEIEITQGNNQIGATDARLEDYLEVKVTDGNNRPLSGVVVQFSPAQLNLERQTLVRLFLSPARPYIR